MAQKRLQELLPITARTEVGEFSKRLLAVLEARFHAIEEKLGQEERTIEVIRQVAIDRINSAVTPIVQNALEDLHSIGKMFSATISETHTVALGNDKVFVIDAAERHTFAALDWVAIRAIDNSTASMSGPINIYNPDTGELVVDVVSITGSGTYTGWRAHVSVPYDPAVEAMLYDSPEFTGNPKAPTAPLGDNDTTLATTAFVQIALADLAATVPETLNTLNELAAALGEDPNFAATTSAALDQRLRVDIATQNLTATQKGFGQTNLDVYSRAGIEAWVGLNFNTKAEVAAFGYATTTYVTANFATYSYVDGKFYTIAQANSLYSQLINALNAKVDNTTFNNYTTNATATFATYAWTVQVDTNRANWVVANFTQPYQVDAKVTAYHNNIASPNFATYGYVQANYYTGAYTETRIQAWLATLNIGQYQTIATANATYMPYSYTANYWFRWETYNIAQIEDRAYQHAIGQANALYNNTIVPNFVTYGYLQGNYYTAGTVEQRIQAYLPPYATIASMNNFVNQMAFSGYIEGAAAGNVWNIPGANVVMQGLYVYQGGTLYAIAWRHLSYYVPNAGWITAGAMS